MGDLPYRERKEEERSLKNPGKDYIMGSTSNLSGFLHDSRNEKAVLDMTGLFCLGKYLLH